MKLTLWEHCNDNAPTLKNWQMVERQDPAIMPGLCLLAQGSDKVGKVAYSIDGSDFIHGGLRRYSSFIYVGEKKIFFPYFESEPRMVQEIALDQKLDFTHAVPLRAAGPQEGRYDTLALQQRESMENKVQDAYSWYILSEFVKPALQQELDHHGLAMISRGNGISSPIIIEKGTEKDDSPDNTIAILTSYPSLTGKRVQILEICKKSAESALREIYSGLQTRFGYQVEIQVP